MAPRLPSAELDVTFTTFYGSLRHIHLSGSGSGSVVDVPLATEVERG